MKKSVLNNLVASLVIAICLFSSCGVKPGGTKSGGKLFETFFVGEQGTQYYIKPIVLTSPMNEDMRVDFTFRHNNEIKEADSSFINFTLIARKNVKNIDSLTFSSGGNLITIKNAKHLFSEKQKDYFLSRFTASGPLKSVSKSFDNADWKITTYTSGEVRLFTPSKKSRKKIAEIKDQVFSLL
jgi:hypothetical protein